MPKKANSIYVRCFFRGLTIFSVLLLSFCGSKRSDDDQTANESSEKKSDDTKFAQYYVKGEQLYLKNCSNCHQADGTGLGRLYPPLKESDYLTGNVEEVICMMRYGKKGEIIVNGKSFNKEMPGVPSLTDLEIAEIATYIYNTWGLDHGIIEVRSVSQTLNKCGGNLQ